MADTNGRTGSDLIDALLGKARAFDFFRVIRQLELATSRTCAIGRDGTPAGEVVRIRPEASFRFPPGAIANITADDRECNLPLVMTITFFGLYGRFGTLPWHYTSRIIHQERPSLADINYPKSGLRPFLDIFNHRLASHFYRAGIKYRWPLSFRERGEDETSRNFVAFIGLGTLHVRDQLNVPDISLLRYAALFIVPNSASSLAVILSDFLGAPVHINQFKGEWLQVEEADRNRIGFRKGNNCLGQSFTIGQRIFSRQHRFRVVIGPVDFECYTSLFPDRERFKHLVTLVRLRTGAAMKFDFAIKVKRETVPHAALGRGTARLGRTFFLLSGKKHGPISSPIFKSDTPAIAGAQQPENAQTATAYA